MLVDVLHHRLEPSRDGRSLLEAMSPVLARVVDDVSTITIEDQQMEVDAHVESRARSMNGRGHVESHKAPEISRLARSRPRRPRSRRCCHPLPQLRSAVAKQRVGSQTWLLPRCSSCPPPARSTLPPQGPRLPNRGTAYALRGRRAARRRRRRRRRRRERGPRSARGRGRARRTRAQCRHPVAMRPYAAHSGEAGAPS